MPKTGADYAVYEVPLTLEEVDFIRIATYNQVQGEDGPLRLEDNRIRVGLQLKFSNAGYDLTREVVPSPGQMQDFEALQEQGKEG